MQKSALLVAIQHEIHRHDFSHFVDELLSVAEGGNDAMPLLLDRLSSEQNG